MWLAAVCSLVVLWRAFTATDAALTEHFIKPLDSSLRSPSKQRPIRQVFPEDEQYIFHTAFNFPIPNIRTKTYPGLGSETSYSTYIPVNRPSAVGQIIVTQYTYTNYPRLAGLKLVYGPTKTITLKASDVIKIGSVIDTGNEIRTLRPTNVNGALSQPTNVERVSETLVKSTAISSVVRGLPSIVQPPTKPVHFQPSPPSNTEPPSERPAPHLINGVPIKPLVQPINRVPIKPLVQPINRVPIKPLVQPIHKPVKPVTQFTIAQIPEDLLALLNRPPILPIRRKTIVSAAVPIVKSIKIPKRTLALPELLIMLPTLENRKVFKVTKHAGFDTKVPNPFDENNQVSVEGLHLKVIEHARHTQQPSELHITATSSPTVIIIEDIELNNFENLNVEEETITYNEKTYPEPSDPNEIAIVQLVDLVMIESLENVEEDLSGGLNRQFDSRNKFEDAHTADNQNMKADVSFLNGSPNFHTPEFGYLPPARGKQTVVHINLNDIQYKIEDLNLDNPLDTERLIPQSSSPSVRTPKLGYLPPRDQEIRVPSNSNNVNSVSGIKYENEYGSLKTPNSETPIAQFSSGDLRILQFGYLPPARGQETVAHVNSDDPNIISHIQNEGDYPNLENPIAPNSNSNSRTPRFVYRVPARAKATARSNSNNIKSVSEVEYASGNLNIEKNPTSAERIYRNRSTDVRTPASGYLLPARGKEAVVRSNRNVNSFSQA